MSWLFGFSPIVETAIVCGIAYAIWNAHVRLITSQMRYRDECKVRNLKGVK